MRSRSTRQHLCANGARCSSSFTHFLSYAECPLSLVDRQILCEILTNLRPIEGEQRRLIIEHAAQKLLSKEHFIGSLLRPGPTVEAEVETDAATREQLTRYREL